MYISICNWAVFLLWPFRCCCCLFFSCFYLRGLIGSWNLMSRQPHYFGLLRTIGKVGELRTRDRKVAGSSPDRSGGRIFFSGINFLCWLLPRYALHHRVTAVARKKYRSFCQKCRWLMTAKHVCSLRRPMWRCMKWRDVMHGCINRTRRDGSSFEWHQPCQTEQRCNHTT